MPRSTGRNRPSDPERREPTPQPRPAVDHTSAVGGNLPWPFAGGPAPADPDATPAEVVGIEIFDTEPDPSDPPVRRRSSATAPGPRRSTGGGRSPRPVAAAPDAPTEALPAVVPDVPMHDAAVQDAPTEALPAPAEPARTEPEEPGPDAPTEALPAPVEPESTRVIVAPQPDSGTTEVLDVPGAVDEPDEAPTEVLEPIAEPPATPARRAPRAPRTTGRATPRIEAQPSAVAPATPPAAAPVTPPAAAPPVPPAAEAMPAVEPAPEPVALEPAATPPVPEPESAPTPVRTSAAEPAPEPRRTTPLPPASGAPEPPSPVSPTAPPQPDPARRSLLTAEPGVPPAVHGWRGALNRRFSLNLAPSAGELSERRSEDALSRSLARPRTIAVVNGKGGSNKTPTVAVLAAVLARYSGAGVLAWDNNETRGTLGWRTESGAHEGSVHDLLESVDELLAPSAAASDLARFVHHQPQDHYDVLRSGGPRGERLSRRQYDAIHRLVRKYYRIVVVDSGNDESADRWQQMVERADRLVIATTALGEHAESGALLLEDLRSRGGHAAELARDAVIVVSQSDRDRRHGDARRVAEGLRSVGGPVLTVPFDHALHSGRIRFDALNPASRRAWLAAAAAVAERP